MKKSPFILLTLSNGGAQVIIAKEHIALAMRITMTDNTGKTDSFTRIIPKGIVIDSETNWLDVSETPEKILAQL